MMTSRRTFVASVAGAGLVSVSAIAYRVLAQDEGPGRHHSTPVGSPQAVGCQAPMTMGTPGMMGTPMADVDFDLMYIDMMIPHHESVIALADVAVDVLDDERLVAIAENILETQPDEVEELRQLREEWYGEPEPTPMTEESMSIVMRMEHGGCSTQGHMDQMRPEWQVEQFEQAEDKDLAFIRQVLAHHQMAVDASVVALEEAEREEIQAIAERVIAHQQTEIDALRVIRDELWASPAA